MPAMDSEVPAMEEPRDLEEGGVTGGPFQFPPTSAPSSTPSLLNTSGSNFTSESEIETKAVSMASNNCSSASLSSPAEASPAKPAVASPTMCHSPTEADQTTSQLASAALLCTETGLVKLPQSPPLVSSRVSPTCQSSNSEGDAPAALTHKDVTVTLENNSVWEQFHSCTTEMILTKQGRRMFPYCRYRLSGLEPSRMYILVLSIVPADQYKYRWSNSKWEPTGVGEHDQGLNRVFSHHYSPSPGSAWMSSLVSFYKLKLTNNMNDQEGHIVLHSMHRYIPRLHVIPAAAGELATPGRPMSVGPECMTFVFPQTKFMAVTTYQNFRITQLKINHNPFAKGFREEGSCSRLNRIIAEVRYVTEAGDPTPEVQEENVDLSINGDLDSTSITKTRLVLKPIMSSSPGNTPYVPCLRGKHALGDLVLVEDPQPAVPKTKAHVESVTPKATRRFRVSSQGTSLRLRKRRRRINRRWANSHGRRWKAASASPTVVHSPSLTVAMQPELDDVEGLLFVSFSSKEALEFHVRDKSPNSSQPSTNLELKETKVVPETGAENLACLEAALLQDLPLCRHKQVLHPTLQEVGLKLSAVNADKPIDLKYLGVHLPLPSSDLPQKSTITSPSDEGLPFISRTGKTSDMTKIKGWKSKFIKSKETSPSCDASQKNLSAFCSNMLDEYLESEAQKISERAAAFSTNPEGRVAYQLPAKSSSYVKTLDSVLKHRSTVSKCPVGSNRPCPLSHKHLFNFAPSSSVQTGPKRSPSVPRSSPSHLAAELKACSPPVSHGASAVQQMPSGHQPVCIQRPVPSHTLPCRSSALNKFQSKLLEMETGTLNEGLSRTQLTEDRLNVALSVLLTKEMHPSQILKVARYPVDKTSRTECGWDFCRLGCVCASLQYSKKAPLHCQRPECMLACACFKQKITKQLSTEEQEAQGQPVYSVINIEAPVQPQRGLHAKTLWRRSSSSDDPEPVFAPSGAQPCLNSTRTVKHVVGRQTRQMRDVDPASDPSVMTCARSREFRRRARPEVSLEPKISEKPSQRTAFDEKEARKQIEIQSGCQWRKDRKKVLEELCIRMNQNNIPQSFVIEPYRVQLITKIVMLKPSGSVVKYRLHISQSSANNEEESERGDKEKHTSDGEDVETDEEEEEEEEAPVMQYGVTPFLCGVLPAGRLRATTKPVGCQASGLIQVNGKTYNQARLLLGAMGSLHPANRLAAYITGRVNLPAEIGKRASQKLDPAHKAGAAAVLPRNAAGSAAPSAKAAPAATVELKTAAQLAGKQSESGSSEKGFVTLLLPPQSAASTNLAQTLATGDLGHSTTFQNGSTAPTVSLTVSPSLKTPSFLGQSGTFSFRICPPSNQGPRSQTQQGVLLPGGFTLIQLPSQKADGDSQQLQCENTGGAAQLNRIGLDIAAKAKEILSGKMVKPEFFRAMNCDDHLSSEESEASNHLESDGNDSESSDYSEQEEEVDVVNVDGSHQSLINGVVEDSRNAVMESQNSCEGLKSPQAVSVQHLSHKSRCENLKLLSRRETHTWVERLRRSELRELFDKLHSILQSNPKPPRLHLLSMAQNEIDTLVETSKYLQEQKKKLLQKQQAYLKELSLKTGKPEKDIQNRLMDFFNEEKLKEKTLKFTPFFSNLLQSRAALLQADNSQTKTDTMPLLPSNFLLRSSPNPSASVAAQDSAIHKPLSMQPSQPEVEHTTPSEAQPAAAPSAPTERQDKISDSNQKMSVKDATSTQPSAIEPVKEITFPLVRSKSGRIILPSSLKPICQNMFPLVVEKSRQTGEGGEEPSGNQKREPDRPAGVVPVTEMCKPLQPSNSKLSSPMASVTFLNKSILLVKKALQAAEQVPAAQPQPAPPAQPAPVQRSRGRPRKTPPTHVKPAPARAQAAAGDSVKSLDRREPSTPVQAGPKENVVLSATKGDSPALLKRGRGRPPKMSSSEGLWIPPVLQRESVTPKSDNIPDKFSKETRKARPLTRAALGKDFPSAKKRSWIDMEKELEQDTDSE